MMEKQYHADDTWKFYGNVKYNKHNEIEKDNSRFKNFQATGVDQLHASSRNTMMKLWLERSTE